MTVRTETLRARLRVFEKTGYQIVPLAQVLAWHAGAPDTLSPRAVVLTVDNGHRSVHEVMWPLLSDHPVSVTLFVYPSAISNADYAMNWDQLRTLSRTGWFEVQSHSYWHPDFHVERARRTPEEFRDLVHEQLRRARVHIEAELGKPVRLLAWPFGIHDPQLEAIAAEEGYEAAFTIDAEPLGRRHRPFALPRYLITDQCGAACMTRLLQAAGGQP